MAATQDAAMVWRNSATSVLTVVHSLRHRQSSDSLGCESENTLRSKRSTIAETDGDRVARGIVLLPLGPRLKASSARRSLVRD